MPIAYNKATGEVRVLKTVSELALEARQARQAWWNEHGRLIPRQVSCREPLPGTRSPSWCDCREYTTSRCWKDYRPQQYRRLGF